MGLEVKASKRISGNIHIREISERDLPVILRMASKEGWVSDLVELGMFIEFSPFGCFVCTDGNKVIGSIMVFCHTRSAWIGNFIVSKEYRRKGIGKKLLSQAIECLDKKKIEQIYLNSAYQARGLYKEFGFNDVIPVNRWEGRGMKHGSAMVDSKKAIPDIMNFLKLDAFLWKDERFCLVSQLASVRYFQSCFEPSGFLMYGDVGNVTTIGPWEVEGADEKIAEELFIRGLSKLPQGRKILLDVPIVNKTVKKILTKYNFKIVGSTMFMCRGRLPKIHFDKIFSFATMGSMG